MCGVCVWCVWCVCAVCGVCVCVCVCATMCLNERCAPVNFARFRPCAASTVKEKVYIQCM